VMVNSQLLLLGSFISRAKRFLRATAFSHHELCSFGADVNTGKMFAAVMDGNNQT
jgi:hypothetical protein